MLKLAIIFAAVSVCYGQISNQYFLVKPGDFEFVSLPDGTTQGATFPEDYDKDKGLTILIHGHEGSKYKPFNNVIIKGLHTKAQNVIVVDWGRLAQSSYSSARRNVPEVARRLSTFIEWLTSFTETVNAETVPVVTVEKIHLVGFGLGAHVAGQASRGLNPQVARITGLDPSGNGWGKHSNRLEKDAAVYVEVIHTDGSGPLANGIGTAIGHIDIYVNGGSNQPGCFSHSCSHDRAWRLFQSSLENYGKLLALPCSSMTQMNLNRCVGVTLSIGGTDLNKNDVATQTIYRINTGRNYPFLN